MEWRVERAMRLDAFLRERLPALSNRRLRQACDDQQVLVNGRPAKKGDGLSPSDLVATVDTLAQPQVPQAVDQPLVVLFRDTHFVVVNKEAGIHTHPLDGSQTDTVANRVVHHFPSALEASENPMEGGAAHRLDRNTSGALAFALHRSDWLALRQAFGSGQVEKEYLAVVEGRLLGSGCVNVALMQRGKHVRVDPNGLPARTHWSVLANHGERTLVRCYAQTGRMHQIRAHLASLGHPLVGDDLYGATSGDGHFLHGSALRCPFFELSAPLPAARANRLKQWGLSPS